MIVDREEDRKHPTKKNRPIASGKVSTRLATVLIMFLLTAAFFIFYCAKFSEYLYVVVCIYFIMNVIYCLKLKNIAIIDVCIIGIGFVIRVIIGGLVTNIALSHWIIIMTFLLAIFLGFAKRLDDVRIYETTGVMGRKSIIKYNTSFLIITATITIVAYLMYTVSEEVVLRFGTPNVYLNSIFVIIGIFRYLQLTMVDKKSESPTKILIKDKIIQGCILMWVLSFVFIIYIL